MSRTATPPEGQVVVHGRDFTAYRVWGAIAALLLAIALVVEIVFLFGGRHQTTPEVRWGVSVIEGQQTGDLERQNRTLAAEVLKQRTQLQEDRARSGPAPASDAPRYALSQGELLTESPMNDGAGLTRSWATADSATSDMLRQGQKVVGTSSLPYANAPLFERPNARDWRIGLADVATHIGAIALLGFSFLLALLLAVRGRVPIAKGRSGRTVKRFNFLERANHWMTALSFIMLALTGLTIAFGDTLIRPFGKDVLGWSGWLATWGHAIFVPSFTLGVVAMALMWTWRNLPSRLDWEWLKRGGGFFSDSGDNPPARKFNAGQKLIFWSAFLGGGLMIVSGLLLMFPYYWLDLEAMSWAMLTHAIIGALLITVFVGHIYIGTVGMQGAFWAMWGGDVDLNWAEEHHELWVRELGEHDPKHTPARRTGIQPVVGRKSEA
ncbi:formate dehydrogenase subunit gamma [Brevirhabdus sp.]|uniref:formate dehydrogenase subunit gamma n=1 Tax=Brevirhabdus sp. TaxID=2004514 RepID=UPI004058AFDB